MLKQTFSIPDMTCTNCAMKLESLEDDLNGVHEINASYHKQQMVVEYDEAKITVEQIIAAAKQKPETISYASVGSGSVGHLAMALLSQRAGVKLVHVPYRGGGPAMNDAVAGHVDLLVGSTALSMPQVDAGTIRPISQTGKTRNPFLAKVPTVSESGFPDFEAYAWWGIFAPAGTPKPIVERFGNEMAAALREERVAKQLTETQQVSLTLGGPEVERKFVTNQMQVWGKVVKDNNIKADQN